jgi:hypothetical protein
MQEPNELGVSSSFLAARSCNGSPSHSGQASQIPPEIWLKVFSYVSWIPGAFEVSDHAAVIAFTRDKHGISVHNRYRLVMDSKLAISLVCWNWHSLIYRSLFEYLLVKSGEQASRMAASLEDHMAMDHQGRGPGWWAVRLELALEGVHDWTGAHADALAHILRHCPNLVVFSTAFSTFDAYLFHSSSFIDAISEFSRCSKLKRLELKGDVPLLEAVISVLAPSLEVIWVLPPRKSRASSKSWCLILPKLHTLISGFIRASCLTELWEMPSLQTLFMEDIIDLENCSQRTGHHLQRILVPSAARILPLLCHCPQLHELVIDCSVVFFAVRLPLRGLYTHPSIRRIVIEDPDFIRPVSWYMNTSAHVNRRLLATLASLTSENHFPALDCVRFVLPLQYEASIEQLPSCLSLVWNSWLDTCREQGIQVQISRGAEEWTADIWQDLSAEIIDNAL